jgi:hypothetical protein
MVFRMLSVLSACKDVCQGSEKWKAIQEKQKSEEA